MKDWLREYLVAGLNGSLKENSLAWRLFSIVNSGDFIHLSREAIWSTLTADNCPKQPIKSKDDATSGKMQDFRFRNLCLQNVKKFPGKENDRYYGLSFLKNGYPVSSVFLGANGVGKSSIYAALEYIGMRKSNTAALRGYYSDNKVLDFDQSRFLTHVRSQSTDVKIFLETESSPIKIDGILSANKKSVTPLICDAFYCSDFDIRQLETCRDYSDYMIWQLGFGLYDKCIQALYYTLARVASERRKLSENKNVVVTDSSEIYLRLSLAQSMNLWIIKKGSNYLLNKNSDYVNNCLSNLAAGIPLTKDDFDILRKNLSCELKVFYENKWYTNLIFELYSDLDSSLAHITSENDDQKKKTLSKHISDLLNARNRIVSSMEENRRAFNKIAPEMREAYTNDQIEKLTNYKIKQRNTEQLTKQFAPIIIDDQKNTIFNQEFEQLISFLEQKFNNTLSPWLDKIKICITELLSGYFEPDNDKISVNLQFNPYYKNIENILEYDSSKKIYNHLEFQIRIKSSGGLLDKDDAYIDKDPRDYLNTFKFKLFCVSLKVAFCCVAKDIYNTNFPLVIDDVFDASDFENRIQLKNFMRKLLLKHDELLPALKGMHQFIFFTQDDVIAVQVAKGIKIAYNSSVKFGHIFDYHELKSNEEHRKEEGSDQYKLDKPLEIVLKDQKPTSLKFYQMDDELSF